MIEEFKGQVKKNRVDRWIADEQATYETLCPYPCGEMPVKIHSIVINVLSVNMSRTLVERIRKNENKLAKSLVEVEKGKGTCR